MQLVLSIRMVMHAKLPVARAVLLQGIRLRAIMILGQTRVQRVLPGVRPTVNALTQPKMSTMELWSHV